jgi:hypothetical protein
MPGWLRDILTDAESAGDIASTLILAADDLEDGTATTVDLRRWGHELRGDLRDDGAELASTTASFDVLPVVWRVTGAPDELWIGQRYRLDADGVWLMADNGGWSLSAYASLAAMVEAGFQLVEDVPSDPVPAVSEQEATD